MPTQTADYWFIELALAERGRTFEALDREMADFKPLPLASFDPQKQAMWAQLRPINLDRSPEDLGQFIDSQIAARYSDDMQIADRFLERFAAEQVAIITIAHALCEAIINAILAIGLSHCGQQDLFVVLESSDLKVKWSVVPLTFLPAYTLPKSGALYGTVVELCKRRNAIVHSKITLSEGDAVLVKGSPRVPISLDSTARQLTERFLRLPYDLYDHVSGHVTDPTLRFKMQHLLSAARS